MPAMVAIRRAAPRRALARSAEAMAAVACSSVAWFGSASEKPCRSSAAASASSSPSCAPLAVSSSATLATRDSVANARLARLTKSSSLCTPSTTSTTDRENDLAGCSPAPPLSSAITSIGVGPGSSPVSRGCKARPSPDLLQTRASQRAVGQILSMPTSARASGSAPLPRRKCAAVIWPWRHAKWSGVRPSPSDPCTAVSS
mmetsp:Transcript_45377/g.106551  ORF Transcript_45377/g.106551 Transcript_45377/m.106551 type:complete len:201 (+) Transcript_45377:542-1144(+)